MRNLRNPQLERGEVRIEDIKLNHKCRDDMPTLLSGLQYLYSQEASRDRLFALLDEFILPGINKKVGRPGMDMWSILVMGVVKQGLGCDFDRLHELVNEHKTLRKFLGHPVISDKLYQYQTLVDNVSLLNPELLGKVNHLIVESGHTVVGKKPGEPLRGRCDSFVVETNVRYPTDVGLLRDAILCMLRYAGRAASKHEVSGLRQWKKLQKSVRDLFNKIRKTRRASRKDIKAYLKACANLIGRVKALLLDLAAKEVSPKIINKIMYFVMHAVRQIDQIDRRLLKGETIPQNEKVFSIFEPHTRWISKGKAGCPVELGVPVCIIEDPYQFILHHEVMWTGSDVDFAVPIVEITKELFPDFCAASFDRGFHSPANRVRLDELLVDNVLPKKGRLSKADREREQGETFAAMRRQHPAVESAINNLEHRGLDRVRSKGRKGFARSVALAVVALNVHRLGRVLRQQALERHRPAA